MTEEQRKKRNADKLAELYPTFKKRMEAWIAEIENRGFRLLRGEIKNILQSRMTFAL